MTSATLDAAPIARAAAETRLGAPAIIALLWLAAAFVHAFGQVRFPNFEDGTPTVSSILYLSTGPVLAALVAAAVARKRSAVLPLAGGLLVIELIASLMWVATEFAIPESDTLSWTGFGIALLGILAGALCIAGILRGDGVSPARRRTAAAAALAAMIAWQSLSIIDQPLLAMASGTAEQATDSDFPEVDEERLWPAQPALVERALAGVDRSPTRAGNRFVVAVAAGGIQDLFGREARLAQSVLSRAFGAAGRSVLLANDEASLHRVPLASNANLDAVLTRLGRTMDSERDVAILYLASHGSRQAELSTDLPDYESLQPIGARRLAAALDRAGIKRRIVIVSACYAGSWIAPLKSDDTIVVTAARQDRSSFGCTDERELTYFGEALLKGPIASGASLAESFAAAKASVARWESGEDQHSEPQAYIGRNMRAVWTARPASQAAAR
ncbi:C13 family peptidase [Sphingomonas mesophila]|uniref:C13 family peptidase n=1 Tax=Sphingomonas mesophila TaxID=2303576 RepID=UPI000E5812AD|nr:C13 family peptidase [Sphingomonas mesophila]